MPPASLRGARYLRSDTSVPDLARAITEYLPTLDLDRTLQFYETFRLMDPTPSDHALLACNDLFYLMIGLCNRRDAIHPWIFARFRMVEAEPDNCLDLWARGHYKSSCITFAKTIQDVLTNPELTVGIFSYSRSTAQKFLAQIGQEFERNENLRACFPDVLYWEPAKESPRWSIEKGLLLKREGNPKEATIEAHGLVEGQPTGVHFQMLVFDDMIEQRNVTNPEQIQKATEAWELSDNLGIGPGTVRRYVGTRYALGDTYQSMIDRKVVKVRLFPATGNGREDGKPVLWDDKTWQEKRITQRSTLAAQLLQNPAAGKQSMFDLGWMRPYDIKPTLLNVYIMADPSRGRTVRSDRTAFAVIGIDVTGNKYLLDGARHRMKLSERWDMLRMLHDKWSGRHGVAMVRVGYERFGQQSDDEYFTEQIQKLPMSEQFVIDELAWPNEGRNSKQDRVQRLQPDFEKGKFMLPPFVRHPEFGKSFWKYNETDKKIDYWPINESGEWRTKRQRAVVATGSAWRVPDEIVRKDEQGNLYDVTRALVEEMILFPFGSHDDLVDATSRIYDMQPAPPVMYEQMSPEQLYHQDA